MADIAREANVNRITVSRALSRPDLVAEGTLKRIQEAIAKTGYIPNQVARGMKSEHSRIVSLITPPQMAGVYGAILERFASALYESGLIVNLFPVLEIEEQRETVLQEATGWRPAAVVLFGIQLSDESQAALLNAHTRVVELMNYREEGPGTCVGYDQREAAMALTDHLQDRGYGTICYVHSANPSNTMNALRLSGFAGAVEGRGGVLFLRQAGDKDRLGAARAAMAAKVDRFGAEIMAMPNFQAGYDLMAELSRDRIMPRALLFASDMVAVGALQYCLSHGVDVPGTVALCAFDGTELTSLVRPRLTSLDLPYERVAQQGAEQIVRHVKDRTAVPQRLKIPARVLQRDST